MPPKGGTRRSARATKPTQSAPSPSASNGAMPPPTPPTNGKQLENVPESPYASSASTKPKRGGKGKTAAATHEEKEKTSTRGKKAVVIEPVVEEMPPEEEDEDENGVTQCVCDAAEAEERNAGFMVQCEKCNTWQHGSCMGYDREQDCPNQYYCYECRPDLHSEVWKAIRAKQSAQRRESSHGTKKTKAPQAPPSVASSHSSPSPSPDHVRPHKSPKRRNTMNSRDPELEIAIEQSRMEAERAGIAVSAESPLEAEPGIGRRSRKRPAVEVPEPSEVPTTSHKRRKPSASTPESTHAPAINTAGEASGSGSGSGSPSENSKPLKVKSVTRKDANNASHTASIEPPEPSTTSAAAPAANGSGPGTGRGRRGGRKKEDKDKEASLDVDGNGKIKHPNQYTYRGPKPATPLSPTKPKGHHKGDGARGQGRGGGASAARSPSPVPHSYNVPDHFSHLVPLLPHATPQGISVRTGAGEDQRVTEKGVKVRWPGKRTTIGEMRRRVRQIMEYVSRAQYDAGERERRADMLKEAIHNHEHQYESEMVAWEEAMAAVKLLEEGEVERDHAEWETRELERRKARMEIRRKMWAEEVKLKTQRERKTQEKEGPTPTNAEAPEGALDGSVDVSMEDLTGVFKDVAAKIEEVASDALLHPPFPFPEPSSSIMDIDPPELPSLPAPLPLVVDPSLQPAVSTSRRTPSPPPCPSTPPPTLPTTSQLLADLTRELIQFQERFGAGREGKVYRDRTGRTRGAAIAAASAIDSALEGL